MNNHPINFAKIEKAVLAHVQSVYAEECISRNKKVYKMNTDRIDTFMKYFFEYYRHDRDVTDYDISQYLYVLNQYMDMIIVTLKVPNHGGILEMLIHNAAKLLTTTLPQLSAYLKIITQIEFNLETLFIKPVGTLNRLENTYDLSSLLTTKYISYEKLISL